MAVSLLFEALEERERTDRRINIWVWLIIIFLTLGLALSLLFTF